MFHTASPWTGSGAEVCEKVNVQGTRTIVDACVQEGVKKLVFTSSAGTVYNGVDLINVDERMPFPKEELDPYNVTKVHSTSLISFRKSPPPEAKPVHRDLGESGEDRPGSERQERSLDCRTPTRWNLRVRLTPTSLLFSSNSEN